MELHCDTCAQLRIFEQPRSTDHPRTSGGPDWACTACDTTIAVAPVIFLMDRKARVLLTKAA
jgi:hypothetical protein